MTETPTATQWYIARDGSQHGPLSDAEIRMFVQSGHMRPNDLVWRPGFADWQPAAKVFPPPPAPASGASPAAPPPAGPSARSSTDASQPRVDPRSRPEAAGPLHSSGSEGGSPAAGPSHRPNQTQGAAANRSQYPEPNSAAAHRPAGNPGPQGNQAPQGNSGPQGNQGQPGNQAFPGSQVTSTDQADDEFGDEFEDRVPAPRRRSGRAAGAMIVAVAVLGGGGWLVAQNQDAILAMANITTASTTGVPVVKAEDETKTAALDQGQPATPPVADSEEANAPAIEAPAPTPVAAEAPQRPAVTPQMIDENFQRSPLWTLLKADYPEWYETNVKEAARIVSAGTEADMAKHLILQLVALRRENAEHALAADTASLINVAQSFLANLKSLASHSAATCYSFIGQGESSPAVIELFPQRGYGEAIEAQIAAIFQAVSNGRKAPVTRVRATKADYDVLAAELTKLGWSKADLRVFADPKALAQTEPEKVCQMVQDWFTAHLAITDAAVQERLMFETLRPIVAG